MPKLPEVETIRKHRQKRKLIVGLTGGIASGKSTVLKEMKRLGAKTLDCDRIAREAVQKGTSALKKIERRFGKEVIKKDGSLNRKILAEIIFNNLLKRKTLEAMIHPEVLKKIKSQTHIFKEGVLVIDIPLLFEAGYQNVVDRIITVWAPKKAQIERLLKRNKLSPQEAAARIRSQWPLAKKAKLADDTIDNSKSTAHTKRQAREIFERLTKNLNVV